MGSPNASRPYWCCKRDRKLKRGSHGGSTKTVIRPTPLTRYLCAHNRSHKHRAYRMFVEQCIKNNGRGRVRA